MEENSAEFVERAEAMMYRKKATDRHKQQEQNLSAIVDLMYRDESLSIHAQKTSEFAEMFGRYLTCPKKKFKFLKKQAACTILEQLQNIQKSAPAEMRQKKISWPRFETIPFQVIKS